MAAGFLLSLKTSHFTLYCMFDMHNQENLRFIQTYAVAVRVEPQPYFFLCNSLIFPAYAWLSLPHVELSLINPQCACAARVSVHRLSVYLYVCMYVRMYVRIFVTTSLPHMAWTASKQTRICLN